MTRAGLVLVLALALSGCPGAEAPRETLTVFAAASLTDALQEAADAFAAERGCEVVTSFASSSALARQIEHGAPADVFVSANVKWMDHLEEQGRVEEGSRRTLVENELVFVGSGAVEDAERIALGDPDHVPAGMYAKEALVTRCEWEALEPRLVFTQDVRGALALVERGECALGIVYASDAQASEKVQVVQRIDPRTHSPIRYPLAVVKGRASPLTDAFVAYLLEQGARFERHGFNRA